MTTELFWLTLSALSVALLWVPYVLNRVALQGVLGIMRNPHKDDPQPSAWASRAQKAHGVAIENFPVFATLILIVNHLDISNHITIGASILYFFGMLAHYILFSLGVPYLRTVAFAVAGFGTEVAIALTALGVL
jgi:uncharacterized MAPEG superfamily protein